MNITSTREVLDSLLREIDATDPEMLPCPHEKEPKDKHLGVCTDDLIKKVYSLSQFYRREGRRMQVDMETSGENLESSNQFQLLKTKHEVLHELMWYLLRTQFNHWHTGIGIRKGWEVVALPNDDEPSVQVTKIATNLPAFLRKLLENE